MENCLIKWQVPRAERHSIKKHGIALVLIMLLYNHTRDDNTVQAKYAMTQNS